MPGMLMTTGMRQASARARNSRVAPEAITPPPARITGRSARPIHCARVSIFSAGTNGTTSLGLATAECARPSACRAGCSSAGPPPPDPGGPNAPGEKPAPSHWAARRMSLTWKGRLGDRLHQLNRVHFLETALLDRQIAAHVADADLAGDHHQRDIVVIGVGDRA